MAAEVPHRPEDRRRVEIVHESLLTNWPRLVGWQTQDADGARVRDELRQAARLWEEHGRSEDRLWTGSTFREFQLWRERYPGGLTELEEAFASATMALAFRRRRRRRVTVAAFVLVFATIAFGTTLLWRRSETSRQAAETEARRATAAKLLALGQLQLDAYPTAALAYATKSLEVADAEEARRFAVRALWRGPTAFILPLPGIECLRLAFSPDARWLATSSVAPHVSVFPSSGGPPIVLAPLDPTAWDRDIEFGPGSDLLATRAVEDPITVWSIPQGKPLRTIVPRAHGYILQRAGYLLALERGKPRWLRRWSLADGSEEDLGPVEVTELSSWGVDPAGEWLALASGRHVLLRATAAVRVPQPRRVGTHSANVDSVAFGPNGTLLSRDVGGEIRAWALERDGLRVRRTLRASDTDGAPRFDRTGTRIAAVNPVQHLIRVWDLTAPPEEEPLELRWDAGEAGRIFTLDFSMAGGEWLAASNLTTASFWPLSARYSRILRGHTAGIVQVRIGPTGWIASSSDDGTARIWRREGEAHQGSRIVLDSGSFGASVSADPLGKRMLVADYARPNRFEIARVDRLEAPLRLESFDATPTGTFDRDGRRVAVSTCFFSTVNPEEIAIRIWDAATGEILKDLRRVRATDPPSDPGYDGCVWDVEFAPDGALWSAGSGGVRKWDVERGTQESVVEGKIMTMDLSDDGRHLLTATRTTITPLTPTVVRYHDLSTGGSRTLTSHGTEVASVALDPTGTIAVTGSSDGTIRVGPVNGEEPHLLFGHEGTVRSVAVSPDGDWIASGAQDATVRIWPMPDLTKPPLHTLPYDDLLTKLRSLTNLRVVADATSPTGYKLDVGPFPGWEEVPEW